MERRNEGRLLARNKEEKKKRELGISNNKIGKKR
jgi:hypothetical protein